MWTLIDRHTSARLGEDSGFANQGIGLTVPGYMNRKGSAVYTSCMGQNFRLFLASNLSVLNFRFFLLVYPGSLTFRGMRPVSSVTTRVYSFFWKV